MRRGFVLACVLLTDCSDPKQPDNPLGTGSTSIDPTASTSIAPDDSGPPPESSGTTVDDPDTTGAPDTTSNPDGSSSSSGTTAGIVCEPGTYGPDCSGVCDCNDGECADGVDGDGSCTCLPGMFGESCAGVCDCASGPCDEGATGTGACLCPDGGGTFTVAYLPGFGDLDNDAITFAQIAAEWRSLGECEPVFVELDQPFSAADLVATGAHVVLASNPSGGLVQYSPAELAAIHDHVTAGNAGFVATYRLFHEIWDNTALADLAGVDPLAHLASPSVACDTDVDVLDAAHPLAQNLPASFGLATSFGFAQPLNVPWGTALLPGAQIVMESVDALNVVVAYEGAAWRGIRISTFPELQSMPDARQLVYNALLWAAYPVAP